jgi:hypothetical protein
MVADIDTLTKTNARNTLEMFVVDPTERAAIRQKMGVTRGQLDQIFAKLEPMLYAPEGKALFQEMKAKRGAYVAAFTKAVDALGTDPELAQKVLKTEVLPAIDALAEPITKLKDF